MTNPIIYYALYGRRGDWRLAASIGLTALVCSPTALTISYTVVSLVGISMVLYGQNPQAIRDNLSWEIIQPFIMQFLEEILPLFAKGIIYATFILTLGLFILFVPTMSASLVSSERQRQTLEVLLITLLTSRRILTGKLVSVLIYLIMPLAAMWALLLVSYSLHGIPLVAVIAGLVLLLVTALSFSMLGLAASTFTKGLTTTMMVIYGVLLPSLFIIPPLVMSMVSVFIGGILGEDGLTAQVFNFYGWTLVGSLNPLSAVIYSAGAYEMEQTFLFIQFQGYWCPSPWLLYVVIYSLMTWVAFYASCWQLDRLSQAKA